MMGSSDVLSGSGSSSWVRRHFKPLHLRRCSLALGAALAFALLATTPAGAALEQRSGSGAGALVSYQTSQVVEGRSVTATVRVFVVVPKLPSLPMFLAVGVKEVDDATGTELFAGTGTGEPGKFTVGPNFARAHVTGQVTVLSAAPGVTRVVDVDVLWSPQYRTQKLRLVPRGGVGGEDPDERHRGKVRRMTGFGIVRISDPTRTDYVITISTPGLGCAWSTRDTSPDVPPPPTKRDGSDASREDSVKSTTAGYWTGYWTWKWDGTQWVATWTWVWKASTNTYVVS